MNVAYAQYLARQWVLEEGEQLPGFSGAFFHGSTNWLPGDAVLPTASDVDLMVVLTGPDVPTKPGKLLYKDVILDVTYLPHDYVRSPEVVLGQSHMAGSFRNSSIISDPAGELTEVQQVVSREFARREWVVKRCEHARDKVLNNLGGIDKSEACHDQVTSWLFAAGVTTHILLTAGLKNPTVRRRYVAVRELLEQHGRLDFYSTLLAMIGCRGISRQRVEYHLTALADIFDVAKSVITTPFFFASDISDIARPVAIDGSRELIERGYHREAVFWIVATYSRCQKVLYHDAPVEVQDKYGPSYSELLSELGVTSFADLQRGGDSIREQLAQVWDVAEAIMAANQDIID